MEEGAALGFWERRSDMREISDGLGLGFQGLYIVRLSGPK